MMVPRLRFVASLPGPALRAGGADPMPKPTKKTTKTA
jgi:hypothetical protein